jgi:preprotein translocase subunit SecG
MKNNRTKLTVICFILFLYFAMFLSFIMGEIKEQADDEELRNLGIHISFYMRLLIGHYGIGLFHRRNDHGN